MYNCPHENPLFLCKSSGETGNSKITTASTVFESQQFYSNGFIQTGWGGENLTLHKCNIVSLISSFVVCGFSGGHSGQIHYHDVRQPEHCVSRTALHQLEVCGLKWTADGRYLASGGNDNLVAIWNASNPTEPMQLLQGHQAAVKVRHFKKCFF